MLTFAITVFLLIVTPGPGVLSTAGFGAAYGYKKSLRYVFGLFLGTNLVFLAVATGLIAILLSIPSLRIFLLILSTFYLFYLASKIALAGSNIALLKPNHRLASYLAFCFKPSTQKHMLLIQILYRVLRFTNQVLL